MLLKSHDYYYYPVKENAGKKCAGMCKQTVHVEVTMSEAFFMHDYPFDRQIIELGITLRRGWTSLKKSPDWNDTGYDVDKQIGTCHLSESILSYQLYPPWEDASAQPWEAKLLLRIEREYDYEINKVILPLFTIVSMSTVAFMLEPDQTDSRIDCALTMMLACIGFQYVLSGFLPKQPHSTMADKYVIASMLAIIGVAVQTAIVKQMMEGVELANMDKKTSDEVQWVDTVTAGFYMLFWGLPHLILWFRRHSMVSQWSAVLGQQRSLKRPSFNSEVPGKKLEEKADNLALKCAKDYEKRMAKLIAAHKGDGHTEETNIMSNASAQD